MGSMRGFLIKRDEMLIEMADGYGQSDELGMMRSEVEGESSEVWRREVSV